jgi:hypothetical protein
VGECFNLVIWGLCGGVGFNPPIGCLCYGEWFHRKLVGYLVCLVSDYDLAGERRFEIYGRWGVLFL